MEVSLANSIDLFSKTEAAVNISFGSYQLSVSGNYGKQRKKAKANVAKVWKRRIVNVLLFPLQLVLFVVFIPVYLVFSLFSIIALNWSLKRLRKGSVYLKALFRERRLENTKAEEFRSEIAKLVVVVSHQIEKLENEPLLRPRLIVLRKELILIHDTLQTMIGPGEEAYQPRKMFSNRAEFDEYRAMFEGVEDVWGYSK